MNTINKVPYIPVFVELIEGEIEPGKVYISEKYKCAVHNCLCGCGQKTVMPLGEGEWTLIKEDDGTVSFTPSVGNFNGENPYHAHYIMTKNIANFV